jgi:stage IV sporulation protein FB
MLLFKKFHTTLPALLILGLTLVWSGNIPGFIMLIAALAIHEYSHLLTGEFLGYRDNEYHLTSLGGQMKLDPLFTLNAETEFLIALSGPAVNWSMVGGVAYLRLLGIDHPLLAQWSRINWILGSLNLIPALPLDGGRILHAVFTRYFGPVKAMAGMKITSWLTAVLLTGWGAAALSRRENGSLLILLAVWIIYHLIRNEKTKIDLSWRLLQHKKRLLIKEGRLPIKPVLVRPETFVKNALREYGGNEYLIFYFYLNQRELQTISEDLAWNSLLVHGFGVTFLETMKAGLTVNLQKINS